jgi:hypothetical protein
MLNKYSFTIGNMGVTHIKHSKYKRLIDNILSELYPDRIFVDGGLYVTAQDFDNKGAYVSIINRAIGNITIIKWLVQDFNFNTFDELISFVENSKIDLFKQGGLYFNSLLEILNSSERKGIRNEKKAIKYIKHYLKTKKFNFRIRQTPLYSKEDVFEGKDLIITINQVDWFVQVKPLVSYTAGETYQVISSGKIKKYDYIHYYIFVNDKECILFGNRNLDVINGIVYVSEKSLKKC